MCSEYASREGRLLRLVAQVVRLVLDVAHCKVLLKALESAMCNVRSQHETAVVDASQCFSSAAFALELNNAFATWTTFVVAHVDGAFDRSELGKGLKNVVVSFFYV